MMVYVDCPMCVQSLLRSDKAMNKYTRLDDEVELSNERYLDDVQSQQQVLIQM